MRTNTLLSLGAALLATLTSAAPANAPTAASQAGNGTASSAASGQSSGGTPAPSAFVQLHNTYVKNTMDALKANKQNSCDPQKLSIRKSWDDLCADERKDYLRAVNCLAAKPAKVDKSVCPGCKNRLDDFTYIHINQTNIIHNSGSLLAWHRQFLWDMEQALRNECHYGGFLPYWDTGRYADDQTKSPVFDGSETSFGGDGKAVPHNDSVGYIPGLLAGPKSFPLPKFAGAGGGCVETGPFKNLSLSLGPVVVANPDPSNLYGYQPNPRCLSRDFWAPGSQGNLTWDRVTELVSEVDMPTLRPRLETTIHLMGHLFIGADGADPFTPCNDPAFYLFHAQIDRVWAIWQGQNLANRTYAIDGPRTFFGMTLVEDPHPNPPANSSAAVTDMMDLGLVGGKMTIKQAMSPTENGRCYMYL